jgi:hypothetical protein
MMSLTDITDKIGVASDGDVQGLHGQLLDHLKTECFDFANHFFGIAAKPSSCTEALACLRNDLIIGSPYGRKLVRYAEKVEAAEYLYISADEQSYESADELPEDHPCRKPWLSAYVSSPVRDVAQNLALEAGRVDQPIAVFCPIRQGWIRQTDESFRLAELYEMLKVTCDTATASLITDQNTLPWIVLYPSLEEARAGAEAALEKVRGQVENGNKTASPGFAAFLHVVRYMDRDQGFDDEALVEILRLWNEIQNMEWFQQDADPRRVFFTQRVRVLADFPGAYSGLVEQLGAYYELVIAPSEQVWEHSRDPVGEIAAQVKSLLQKIERLLKDKKVDLDDSEREALSKPQEEKTRLLDNVMASRKKLESLEDQYGKLEEAIVPIEESDEAEDNIEALTQLQGAGETLLKELQDLDTPGAEGGQK